MSRSTESKYVAWSYNGATERKEIIVTLVWHPIGSSNSLESAHPLKTIETCSMNSQVNLVQAFTSSGQRTDVPSSLPLH